VAEPERARGAQGGLSGRPDLLTGFNLSVAKVTGGFTQGATKLHSYTCGVWCPLSANSFRRGFGFALDKSARADPRYIDRQKHSMKVVTQKQASLAIQYVAELLKRDGAIQTLTVQEWLDAAQLRPAQFSCSLPALELLSLLGFGDLLVQPEKLG